MTRLAVAILCLVFLIAVPLLPAAQGPRVYRVGVVLQGGPHFAAIEGLRDGLREFGFEETKHFILDVRDAKGDLKAVEAAARSLEAAKVDLIYSLATSVTLAVRRATNSVPIFFYVGSDPVVVSLVGSFRKPGGRLTGIHGRFTDLTAKRLELLREVVPSVRRVLNILPT